MVCYCLLERFQFGYFLTRSVNPMFYGLGIALVSMLKLNQMQATQMVEKFGKRARDFYIVCDCFAGSCSFTKTPVLLISVEVTWACSWTSFCLNCLLSRFHACFLCLQKSFNDLCCCFPPLSQGFHKLTSLF